MFLYLEAVLSERLLFGHNAFVALFSLILSQDLSISAFII